MRAILTGSGPASGFPVPGCPCAACALASPSRQPAELLLDGATRLDVDGHVHDGSGRVPLTPGSVVDAPFGQIEKLVDGALILPGSGRPLLWSPGAVVPPSTLDRLAGVGLSFALIGPDPWSLARLRALGAVTDGTRVAIVGPDHRLDAHTLEARMTAWGAFSASDGIDLSLVAPRPRLRGRFVVLGGSGSGKSDLAEGLLAAEPEVLYIATGPAPLAHDAEWAARVGRHQDRRPDWWATVETSGDQGSVAELLTTIEHPVLLDSVGTWLTGVLDAVGAWSDTPGWREAMAAETAALVEAWRSRRAPLVAVTEEVGWSVVPATAAGRLFTTELGALNRTLVRESEHLLVMTAGRLLPTSL